MRDERKDGWTESSDLEWEEREIIPRRISCVQYKGDYDDMAARFGPEWYQHMKGQPLLIGNWLYRDPKGGKDIFVMSNRIFEEATRPVTDLNWLFQNGWGVGTNRTLNGWTLVISRGSLAKTFQGPDLETLHDRAREFAEGMEE